MKISDTAINQYIRCPRQFNEERKKKNRAEANQAMKMGRVVHRTIEKLMNLHKERGVFDYLDTSEAAEVFTEEWGIENGLRDKDLFTYGLQQIHDMIEDLGPLNPENIKGTEVKFSINIDDNLEVIGIIDLILGSESIDEETGECFFDIEVIDWKTSRIFTSQRDADESLQLSIYLMAAREMFPDATSYNAALHMLAERNHLKTRRRMPDLQADMMFIKSIATQIENDKSWRPNVNPDCCYCHIRGNCDAYRAAINGPIPTVAHENEFEALAEERARVALLKRLSEKRQKEIDTIFMTHMKSSGLPLELGEHFFKISQTPRKSYPTLETCRMIAERLNIDIIDVVNDICNVGTTRLKSLIKNYKGDGDTRMLEASLANIVETKYSQRIYYKKAKHHKKGKK